MILMKKVVLLGGGRALSVILKGLKLFPVDITAVIAVSDDGSSAGKLREEFNMPAVGDLRGALIALSNSEPLVKELLGYRFKSDGDLDGHTVGNILLTAMTQIKGNLSDAIYSLGKVFDIKGKILPFTEDVATLVAEMSDGTIVEGESKITEAHKKIEKIYYKEEVKVTPEVLKAVQEADLIVLGIGSLYTSIIPNILSADMREAIKNSKAKKIYISNLMTQSGETDDMSVSDCIKILNKYMGGNFIDVVISSNSKIPKSVLERYKDLEEKSTILIDPLEIDENQIKNLNVKLIQDDLAVINKDNQLEHNSLKTAYHIYSILIDSE